ncbi:MULTISPECIES: hypothetical protein [Tenacibaculum]|uniref:hypothetical protein n=1 Tax=Tenacibaculum TaxID=104267 RepID=UPI001F0B5F35|nr:MULTISPECIES: hypothetical protein [Tenacibaculum]MCH3881043.1 hypothetical protein [Tenacibaculum aquimarinum]MCH3884089.1 hypothetical protein [Tenacibaculum aquimarinum]MDO6599357.1 hypothetical protein [Tenacibaculum sp. 1_MG-2023]
MRTFKINLLIITLCFFGTSYSQEKEVEKNNESKLSYYEKRGKEDAEFEQKFTTETRSEEKKFWKDQKKYEKELKKKDTETYNAYMQGKKDAYREHQNHCDNHCNHGYYYHNHATFYYHSEYRRQPRRSSVGTSVRIKSPKVRIGLF